MKQEVRSALHRSLGLHLDEIICVEVRKGQTEIYTLHGGQIVLGIYGQIAMIDGKKQVFAMPG